MYIFIVKTLYKQNIKQKVLKTVCRSWKLPILEYPKVENDRLFQNNFQINGKKVQFYSPCITTKKELTELIKN